MAELVRATTLEHMDLELVRLVRRRMVARVGSMALLLITGAFASPALPNVAIAQTGKPDPASDIYAPWIVPGASGSSGGQLTGSTGSAGPAQATGPGGELVPVSVIYAARELPATARNHDLPARVRQVPAAAQGSTSNRLPHLDNVAASSYLSSASSAGAGINWILLALGVAGLGLVLRPRQRRS